MAYLSLSCSRLQAKCKWPPQRRSLKNGHKPGNPVNLFMFTLGLPAEECWENNRNILKRFLPTSAHKYANLANANEKTAASRAFHTDANVAASPFLLRSDARREAFLCFPVNPVRCQNADWQCLKGTDSWEKDDASFLYIYVCTLKMIYLCFYITKDALLYVLK